MAPRLPDPRRAARAPLVAVAAGFVLVPLVPSLTPAWPEGWYGAAVLLFSAAALGYVILRLRRGERLDGLDLLLAGAFPLYALYTANGLYLSSGDNLATRRIAAQFLTRGTLDLSKSPPFPEDLSYAAVRVGDRLLPAYPIGTGILQLPYVSAALLASRGEISKPLVVRWEKHFSALLTVGGIAVFYLALARRFGRRAALGAAAVHGIATTMVTCCGQAMWSFTGEVFCVALAMLFLMPRRPSARHPAAAGLAMAAAFLCRPTAALAIVVLGVLAFRTSRRSGLRYGVASLAGITAVLFWQLRVYGHPLGSYGLTASEDWVWGGSMPVSFAGSLLSPSRGLFIWLPWTLFLPLGSARVRSAGRDWFWTATTMVALTFLLASLLTRWWGGTGIGPRYFTEAAPFLAMLTVPLWSPAPRTRALFVTAVCFAAATQVLAAYNPAAANWNRVVQVDDHPRVLWSLRDSQLAASWVPGWQPSAAYAATLVRMFGREDATLTGSIDEPREREPVSGVLRVRGWARISGEDLGVALFLDGVPLAGATRRVPRPDVASAFPVLGDCSRAGWEALFDFSNDRVGPRELTAVFSTSDGRVRQYPVRHFRWEPPR